jgi:hypothetical protein
MNRFIALIMALTAVWILFAIAYDNFSGWFAIFKNKGMELGDYVINAG